MKKIAEDSLRAAVLLFCIFLWTVSRHCGEWADFLSENYAQDD